MYKNRENNYNKQEKSQSTVIIGFFEIFYGIPSTVKGINSQGEQHKGRLCGPAELDFRAKRHQALAEAEQGGQSPFTGAFLCPPGIKKHRGSRLAPMHTPHFDL